MRSVAPGLGIAAVHAIVVAVLAFALHPIEIGFAESDAYVDHVEALLAGRVAYDGFHPANTILAGAMVAAATGLDAFSALRVVSALASGAIVGLTFAIVRRLAPGRPAWPAWLAAACVALNPSLLTHGMQAISDPLAAAFVLAAMHAAMAPRAEGAWQGPLRVGLWAGLAFGTRFATAGFAPLLVLPVLHHGWRRAVPWLAFGGCLGFAPHALVAWLVSGSPFANDSWHNVALKLSGFDPAVLAAPGHAMFGDLPTAAQNSCAAALPTSCSRARRCCRRRWRPAFRSGSRCHCSPPSSPRGRLPRGPTAPSAGSASRRRPTWCRSASGSARSNGCCCRSCRWW
jgi:hypothetical protein